VRLVEGCLERVEFSPKAIRGIIVVVKVDFDATVSFLDKIREHINAIGRILFFRIEEVVLSDPAASVTD
jgi:hypothetical protein